MAAYLTNILITLRLMARDRMALFFGYVFPLIFFFLFAQMMSAGQGGGVAKQVVTSVLIFGVLGNGFFGAGMRAVTDREQNILRRFKVAPTNAAPLLVSWLVTGWINYLPSALFLIAIGHFGYQMPWPERPFTLFVFLSVAVLAFRSLGLIIASVVNSMQESQILIQLFYLPMLFLSGATIPIASMPLWVQIAAQFIPSSHLFAGLQGILLRQEDLAAQWKSLAALLLTLCVGMFLSVKLFRWEKEEKVKASAKLWVLAALAPFLVLGTYQAYTRESLDHARVMQRELRRSRTLLFRDVRLFLGDGRTIERGGLLVRNGRIAGIFDGDVPDPKSLNAEPVDGSGKTLLPGLIDSDVHLSRSGFPPLPNEVLPSSRDLEHRHTAYLYCGVTTIRSVGDDPAMVARLRDRVNRGERLASDLLFTGPRIAVANQQPGTALAWKRLGASALWLDTAHLPANTVQIFQPLELPLLASEGGPAIQSALESDASSGTSFWIPALAALEGTVAPSAELLDRSLVLQTSSKEGIAHSRAALANRADSPARLAARMALVPSASLRIVAGSGSGAPFAPHGPGVHRELALLVRAGMTPADALQAATGRAAAALGIAAHVGQLKEGLNADLLLIDGNPLRDITALERISLILFRGERVVRSDLFKQEDDER
ncbi:MAG TPA: ABC transporter permease [Bryobacteraceae bacterium]|nr:ABC transporter permease [Bryobacteraceae bacterium]